MRFLTLLRALPSRIAIAIAPLLRFLAALMLLAAVASAVSDVVQTGRALSTAEHWQAFSPSSYAEAAAAVTKSIGGWAWDPVVTVILGLPSYLLFGVLAMLMGIAGRRRRVVNVYVN